MTLMNVTEYAKHRGVSRQTIYAAINAERIEREPCGKIDAERADRSWDPKATIQTQPREPDDQDGDDEDDGYDYQSARARREHWSAELTELRAAVEKGELVAVKDVERAWTDALATLRTRLLSLPDRVSDVLAVTDDAHACQQLLADEVTELLFELSAAVAGDE